MTEAASKISMNDQQWWMEKLLGSGVAVTPPLFKRRSKVYRRRSAHVKAAFSPELADRVSECVGPAGAGDLHK